MQKITAAGNKILSLGLRDFVKKLLYEGEVYLTTLPVRA